MIVISIFVLLALWLSPIQGQFSGKKIATPRRLGFSSCEKVVDIERRCCGSDLSDCNCPVREWSVFKSSWKKKCKKLQKKGCNTKVATVESSEIKAFLGPSGERFRSP